MLEVSLAAYGVLIQCWSKFGHVIIFYNWLSA